MTCRACGLTIPHNVGYVVLSRKKVGQEIENVPVHDNAECIQDFVSKEYGGEYRCHIGHPLCIGRE